MQLDDIIYLCLLIFSIVFAYGFRFIRSPTQRKCIGTVVGVLIVFAVSGYHIVHQLLVTLFTILILQFCPKRVCYSVSIVVLFTYLLFFRLCHYFGIPYPPGPSNSVQMMLTLKLIGVCSEVHDTWKLEGDLKKAETDDDKQKLELSLKHEAIYPTPFDIFHYAFTFIGIITGPYYKYRTFNDYCQSAETKGLDCLGAALKRAKMLPLYVVFFFVTSNIFPLSFAESDEIFRDYSVLYRILYMTPIFFTFRMRLYSAFIMSECTCILVGLGAYPKAFKSKPGKGPTDYSTFDQIPKDQVQEYDFETIHNIDEWGSEFSPTVRGGMRSWNMTVQFWLVTNVYKRLPLAKPLKEAITMLTSAFWHGVYPGYYLSLLTVPFILAVEDFYDRKIRRNLGEQARKAYDFFAWILKMQQFNYMSMAFLLLRVDTTLHYWRSIGFIFHGVIGVQHAVGQFINLIIGKVKVKLEKSSQTRHTAKATYRVTKAKDVTTSAQKQD